MTDRQADTMIALLQAILDVIHDVNTELGDISQSVKRIEDKTR